MIRTFTCSRWGKSSGKAVPAIASASSANTTTDPFVCVYTPKMANIEFPTCVAAHPKSESLFIKCRCHYGRCRGILVFKIEVVRNIPPRFQSEIHCCFRARCLRSPPLFQANRQRHRATCHWRRPREYVHWVPAVSSYYKPTSQP